jgi:hypothetical protein
VKEVAIDKTMYVCIYIYIYTYIHTYIHTYINTYYIQTYIPKHTISQAYMKDAAIDKAGFSWADMNEVVDKDIQSIGAIRRLKGSPYSDEVCRQQFMYVICT